MQESGSPVKSINSPQNTVFSFFRATAPATFMKNSSTWRIPLRERPGQFYECLWTWNLSGVIGKRIGKLTNPFGFLPLKMWRLWVALCDWETALLWPPRRISKLHPRCMSKRPGRLWLLGIAGRLELRQIARPILLGIRKEGFGVGVQFCCLDAVTMVQPEVSLHQWQDAWVYPKQAFPTLLH